jgi:hypothetical protein
LLGNSNQTWFVWLYHEKDEWHEATHQSENELSEIKVLALSNAGKNYMMMETAVYTREFLLAKEMRDNGELGRIQFLRGAHYQDIFLKNVF